MKTISERAQAVINAIEARDADRQHMAELLAARIDEMSEQSQVIGELRLQISDLQSARDRLQAFIDTTEWGALESGDPIKAGAVVRFGALTYEARVDHTKALTRTPLNRNSLRGLAPTVFPRGRT